MKNSLLPLLMTSSTLLISACVADPDETDDAATDDGTRFHMMAMQGQDVKPTSESLATKHLNYYGGPVLAQVHNVPVYWNANVAYQANLNAFYNAVPNSKLYDLLHQYSNIGRGNGQAGFVDNRTTTTVSDSAIQTELNRLFTAGSIPLPNANNYYPVHFPSGVSITAPDGSKSCVVFCAYHGTYVRNGVNVNYGVIPDQGGGCAGGCGSNASRVNNLDSVASHELVEATTDPAVGLATVYGPPLAWYDPTYGEIGDICNAQQGTTVGGDGVTYVVQKEFSNATSSCVTQ